MEKKIAFIATKGPHGSATGREGLDALLATSALTDSVALFLMGDGVLLLLNEQQPLDILQRNIAPTFKLLSLYDIEEIYVCERSLIERGISREELLLPVTLLSAEMLAYQWSLCSVHISF